MPTLVDIFVIADSTTPPEVIADLDDFFASTALQTHGVSDLGPGNLMMGSKTEPATKIDHVHGAAFPEGRKDYRDTFILGA